MRKSTKRQARKNYVPDPANNRNIAARAGRWSATHPKSAILGWFVFVALAMVASSQIEQKQIPDYLNFNGQSAEAELAMHEHFPAARATENVLVKAAPGKPGYGSPQFDSALRSLDQELQHTKNVVAVKSALTRDGPSGFVTEDGRAARVQFEVVGKIDDAGDKIAPIQRAVEKVAAAHPIATFYEMGDASANHEIGEMINQDLARARNLSVPITLVILMLAFGALTAAGIPVLLALTAVLATMGLIAIPSQLAPMDQSVGEIVVLIGMAVGIDYSLFYLKREREERAAGKGDLAAIEAAAATSGRAVLISGITVVAAMAGMLLAGDRVFTSFGIGAMLVVVVAMIGSLTVLPALLSAWGKAVDRPRIPWIGKRRERRAAAGKDSGAWAGIVELVLRRPLISAVIASALLLALAYPALQMKTRDMGIDDMPKSLAVLSAYHQIERAFPAQGASEIVVLQASNVRSLRIQQAIAEFDQRLVENDRFGAPATTELSPDGRVAKLTVPVAGGDDIDVALAATKQLRAVEVPETFGQLPGVTVNTTGQSASSLDFNDNLKHRAPLVFVFVLGLAFLLLLITFRSLVIPITAIVLNLLSVAAAYGLLVLVFQHGWGHELLGFTPNGAIWPFLPLFLFVVLFGLSMDYHVFILSRVREGFDRGLSSDDAVRFGIRSTAGVVTSAAAVMVAVFAIFASLGFLPMKQLGVGLAAAILIDATVIRAVLLPASMKLLGESNWYLPRWLEWLPKVRGEQSPADAWRGTEPASSIPQ